MVVMFATAPLAAADPEPLPPPPPPDTAALAVPAANPAPPLENLVPPNAPSTTKTPDGWTLTVSSKDEIMRPVLPLTTAVSSREYVVGGIFNGAMEGPEGDSDGEEHGILEVGYQIGCGIDMSTSNGVTLTGSVGLSPSIGFTGLTEFPIGVIPGLLTPVTGGIAVGLKPGIVNIIPVVKKDFKGAEPWVMISDFHVKIDGCVGQSFIRSYATMTRQTDISDAVLSYVGVTKAV